MATEVIKTTLKQIASSGDPETLFYDLQQIGHGNFGAVYYAKCKSNDDVVAIKKMFLDKNNNEERRTEIEKELAIMSSLKHENVVNFFNVYFSNSCVWIIMEFCVGSLIDIMNLYRNPFCENDISYILKSTITALEFFHTFDWIHRDIKGANILLTSKGIIKLADFGSASLKPVANTFIGSPYWMAPEVILAMEDGVYNQSGDIWSVGITAIELAETIPPRFEMNSMGALYYIAQNPPPTLKDFSIWSEDFIGFVGLCLQKEPEKRSSCKDLLQHSFLTQKTNNQNLIVLINNSFNKIETIDTESYTKIKTLIKCYGENENLSDMSQETNSISNSESIIPKLTYKEDKVQTIRLTKVIAKELLKSEQRQPSYDIEVYQRLRKSLNKQAQIAQEKLESLVIETLRSNDKQLETLSHDSAKGLEKLINKQVSEYEALLKNQYNNEKKMRKVEMKPSYPQSRKKGFTTFTLRRDTSVTTEKSVVDDFTQLSPLVHKLRLEQKHERVTVVHSFMIARQKYEHEEKNKYNELFLSLNSTIDKIKMDNLAQMNDLKLEHLEKIHNAELKGLILHFHKLKTQLRKKHLASLRQKPKKIKSIESALKRKFTEVVKIIISDYKKKVSDYIVICSKEDFIVKKSLLKKDRAQQLKKAEITYQEEVNSKTSDIEVNLSTQQRNETDILNKKYETEQNQLLSSQRRVKQDFLQQIQKTVDSLQQTLNDANEERMNNVTNDSKTMEQEVNELKLQLEAENDEVNTEINNFTTSYDKANYVPYYIQSSLDISTALSNLTDYKIRFPY